MGRIKRKQRLIGVDSEVQFPAGEALLISGEIESRQRDENSQSASFPSDLKIKVALLEKEKGRVCGHSGQSNVSCRKQKGQAGLVAIY